MMIVVRQIGVVVVLVAGQTSPSDAATAELLTLEGVVIVPAEKPVRTQRELVAWDELTHAGRAAETLHVVDLRLGAHHEVVLVEGQPALVALRAEQPVGRFHSSRLFKYNYFLFIFIFYFIEVETGESP